MNKATSIVPKELIEHILSDSKSSKEIVDSWVESLPKRMKSNAKKNIEKILKNSAMEILKYKRRNTAKSKQESEKILKAVDVKEMQPDLYQRIADIKVSNSGEQIAKTLFTAKHPRNVYPFLGVPKTYMKTRTLWGRRLSVLIYSARVVDNKLRMDNNGIAIIDKLSGRVIIDEIRRKPSVGDDVLSRRTVEEFVNIMSMPDKQLQQYLMNMPLALQDYCWPQ